MKTTKTFSKLATAFADPKFDVVLQRGGTRSGKTYSVLQLFAIIALKSKKRLTLTVASETLPHLKKGCIKDFEEILRNDNVPHVRNKLENSYEIGNSVVEFRPVVSVEAMHGGQRDFLFVNEANNIEYEAYRQLAVRTAGKIILDYNPRVLCWIDSKLIRNASVRHTIIQSTYLDNDFLSAKQIREIESNKNDPNWWAVYGEGKIGGVEGLVSKNWTQYEGKAGFALPIGWVGIDFGYTDPTAIVHVFKFDGFVFVREICYAPEMTSEEIYNVLVEHRLDKLPTVADSASPTMIKELKRLGIKNIKGVKKGADSIKHGIALVNKYKRKYVGANLIAESYAWKYKKNNLGGFSTEPEDKNNHLKDAERYVFWTFFKSAIKNDVGDSVSIV